MFTQDTLDYLNEVKKNNSKEWFSENKERYNESLLLPLKEFVMQLRDVMLDIDAQFEVEPRVDRTISRIYRDTRFSKDKSLYKDRAWVTFKKKGQSNVDYPAFFFEVSPVGFCYGMGFYSASVKSMRAIREKIDAEEKSFVQLVDEIDRQKVFSPEGELYKKNRYQGFDAKLADWYNRKNLYLIHHSEHVSELFVADFIEKMKEDYRALKAFYRFFTQALDEQWLKSEGFERE